LPKCTKKLTEDHVPEVRLSVHEDSPPRIDKRWAAYKERVLLSAVDDRHWVHAL